LQVRVVETGPPDGPPVLLLHGWACSAYSWRHQLPALAAAGLRAIAVDLKGHGLTDKPLGPDEYTREAMTTFATETADALGLDRFALVGHSLGGGIATRFALAHPGRVTSLAVLSAVGFGRIPFIPLVRVLPSTAVEPLLPHLMPRWLYRLVLWGVTGNLRQYTTRDVDEYWAATQFPEFPMVLWRLLREYSWSELGAEERGRLQVPLLVVYGSGDRVVWHPSRRRVGARWWGDDGPRADGAGTADEAESGDDADRDTDRDTHPGADRATDPGAEDPAAEGTEGADDSGVAGAAAAMAGLGLHAESRMIDGAGHAAHEEAPEVVTGMLLGFLAGIEDLRSRV
jgi:pimeloyl-ACP methyl ester carboxylesterase